MKKGAIIRQSKRSDSEAILGLIRELAAYEKALQHVEISKGLLELHGHGDDSAYECLVAEMDNKVVGMALFYPRFSTWKGPYLYLEDLIVTESNRGEGIGKALLNEVIKTAKERNSARLEWQVLDWNAPAIEFYRKYNVDFDHEWINVRLTQQKISAL